MSIWIWERPSWPNFEFDEGRYKGFHRQFEFNRQNMLAGVIFFDDQDKENFRIAVTGMEALKSSEIEGERMDLPKLIGSIKANFASFNRSPRKSIVAMMADVYRNFSKPLTHKTLKKWNEHVLAVREGFDGIKIVGDYRQHPEPMQIVDGRLDGLGRVYYEAPPSEVMEAEMDGFIKWYNRTGRNGEEPLPPLIRAGLAHLYFVAIHPFEDGNGRIARAISERALSEYIGEPTLISLSHAIANSGNQYYDALRAATALGDVETWLEYFCETVLEAETLTRQKLFIAAMKKDIEQNHSDLSEPQKKLLERMMEDDFKGDMSPEKYEKINRKILFKNQAEGGSSDDLAHNHLEDLVRRGLLKHMDKSTPERPRYELAMPHGYDRAVSNGAVVKPAKPQKPRRPLPVRGVKIRSPRVCSHK